LNPFWSMAIYVYAEDESYGKWKRLHLQVQTATGSQSNVCHSLLLSYALGLHKRGRARTMTLQAR
jgi:hypothetical protein